MPQKLLFILLLTTSLNAFAQEMQEGFTYLETGKYSKALVFFETILQQYPKNKTARLCYGRAVGLSGDADKALAVFSTLKKEYPNSYEIKLNYAEALLWAKKYDSAEMFYEKLVTEDPKSFPATLGYANTLSNLKKYKKALDYVNRALQIQKGNPNALTSRKYIRLGYASTFNQNKRYQKALQLLDDNLVDYPNDMDSQLNKANIYLVTDSLTKAKTVYTALATNPKDSIIALNGLALVAHKSFKNKKALKLSNEAIHKVERYKDDQKLYYPTQERYVQALLWNKKFIPAKNKLKNLGELYPDHIGVWSLLATYGMYTGNFKTSIKEYNRILNKDSTAFDGNLGIANGYRAVGKDMQAYSALFKTLTYYPKQPDAEQLIATLKKTHSPWIEQKTAFTFDNGNNEAIHASLMANLPFSTKFKTTLGHTYRTTRNTLTKNKAFTNELSLSLLYKLSGMFSLATKGGISQSNALTNDYTQWTGELLLQTKPYRLQNLAASYQRILQDFNADLIEREIVMNNYSLNYTMGTTINLGWYTQYMYTSQSDTNKRNLLFTSLFYSFLDRPAIKTGINYQHITFKNQVPSIYFSPAKFNVVEVFLDMTSTQTKKWFYAASMAAGYQYIDDTPASTTFRTEGKLGYQATDRFIATLYGKYSTIASATAAGFRFTEFGILLKWYFLRNPIFNKKIMALDN